MRQLPFDTFRMMTRCLDRWQEFNILDLGASVGAVTERAAMEFPLSRIWSLEPEPASFAALQKRSAPLKRVKTFNLAASDTAGTQTFHVTQLAACSSLLPISNAGADYYPQWSQPAHDCQVQTVKLNQWAPTVGLSKIDILKIDVQGMELQVLRTLERQLANNILAIDCEAQFIPEYEGGSTFLDIACLLRDHGFILHQVHNIWACGNESQTTCMDGLWLKKPLIDRLRSTPAPLLDPGPSGVMLRAMIRMRELGMSRIAFYGAGSFTQNVLASLTDPPLQIVCIADDNPSRHDSKLAGIPVVSLESAGKQNIDALVLSSDGHEQQLLANTSHLRDRGLVVVPIHGYHPEFDSHHPLKFVAAACAA